MFKGEAEEEEESLVDDGWAAAEEVSGDVVGARSGFEVALLARSHYFLQRDRGVAVEVLDVGVVDGLGDVGIHRPSAPTLRADGVHVAGLFSS